MLEELHVANLGLLADVRIEPGGGLVVVTGETGAGKTMLLGALELLGGGAARRDRVGPAGDELLVEGRFTGPDGEQVAARRVTRTGRSRAYEDGAMVTATRLGEVFGPLMEIVAQHDALALARPAGVLDLIDGGLPPEGRRVLDDYVRAWSELDRLRAEQRAVGGDRRALERELDAARSQADEIAAAALQPREDVDLAARAGRLRNAAALQAGLAAAHQALVEDGGAIDRVGNVIAELRRLAGVDSSLQTLYSDAVAASDALAELGSELAAVAADIDDEPEALEQVEYRIHQIGDLRRKYGDTVADVIEFGEAAAERAAGIQRRLAAAETLDGDIIKAESAVLEAADVLRAARSSLAAQLLARAGEHLRQLGMADPHLELELEAVDPGTRGTERARLGFASDRSLPAGPVNRIASGGELSRVVLSLRLAAGAGDVPIVAFDEIDAGVGGATALAMGEKLARLARGRQVFCVSHLPQIAAFADNHYVVERQGAAAGVRPVAGVDRAREIARMLAGLGDTSSGIDHAAELLEAAAARLEGGGG